jgi:hypothetical protein
MDDFAKRLCAFIEMLRRIVPQLSEPDFGNVESALCEVLGLVDHRDLLKLDLSDEDVIRHLRSFDFRKFHPQLLAQIEMDEPEIPVGVPLHCLIREADFRISGRLWRIYRNDADPFPSNPHAHWVKEAWKLDLANGDAYLGREFVGWRMPKPDFARLRRAAESRGIALPHLAR